MTTIINFFGAPGSGKSTLAAKTFYDLKIQNYRVELVTEFAKELVWEEHHSVFQDQLYMLAKQNRKLLRLRNKVDWAITDSPLLLNMVYMVKNGYEHSLNQLIVDVFNSYDNINILLNRTHEYENIGRNHTEPESDKLAINIRQVLIDNMVPFTEINCDQFNFGLIEKLILPRII